MRGNTQINEIRHLSKHGNAIRGGATTDNGLLLLQVKGTSSIKAPPHMILPHSVCVAKLHFCM